MIRVESFASQELFTCRFTIDAARARRLQSSRERMDIPSLRFQHNIQVRMQIMSNCQDSVRVNKCSQSRFVTFF